MISKLNQISILNNSGSYSTKNSSNKVSDRLMIETKTLPEDNKDLINYCNQKYGNYTCP